MADWSAMMKASEDYRYQEARLDDSSFDVLDTLSMQHYGLSPMVNMNARFEECCCPENVDSFINYLNQDLVVLGFRPINMEEDKKLVSSLNHLHEFFQIFQRSSRIKEELENRLHRKSSEFEHLAASKARLKQEKEALEKRIAGEQEKQRQVLVKNKNLSVKLKTEKNELTQMKAVIKDRDHQYKHELRKKERECNKLKERLHQLLSDKNPDRRVGLEMDVSLIRTDGKRGTWKTGSNKQEEMYQLLISDYQTKQEDLMLENKDLREFIMNMQKELNTVLNRQPAQPHQNKVNEDRVNSSSEDEAIFSLGSSPPVNGKDSEGFFQLPYDMMRENLQNSLKETCKKIKENMTRKHSRQSTGQSDAIDGHMSKISPIVKPKVQKSPKDNTKKKMNELQTQLAYYRDVVKQQEDMLMHVMTTQSKSVENSFLQEAQLYEEQESLAEQRRLLQEERETLEKDRQGYLNAIIEFNKKRRAIETERAEELKKQFLQLTPFDNNKTKMSKKGGTRLLPCTPMFSPAPSEKPKTPSTHELYRLLGITPKSVQRKHTSSSCDLSFMEKKSVPPRSADSPKAGSCKSAPSAVEYVPSPLPHVLTQQSDELKTALFRRSSTGSTESLEL